MSMDTAIKVVSFNLKRDSRLAGIHRWENRRELVAKMIEDSGAAIIGVQEMLPAMKEDIKARLADYNIFGVGRTKKLKNEHSAILLHAPELEMRFSKTFWLSKHPEKRGSRAYFAMFPRICTVCEVYSRELNQNIRVFNTHFDHVCAAARTLGVRIILQYMHTLNQKQYLPSILMGDLNAHPSSKPIRILSENLHNYPDIHLNNVYDSQAVKNICNTYHGFCGKASGNPIDYIFVSDEFMVKTAYVDTTVIDGQYPSDHYPLVAVLEMRPASPAKCV